MFDLNRKEQVIETDVTSWFIDRLIDEGVNAKLVTAPVFNVHTLNSSAITLEIKTHLVEDIEYTISSIAGDPPSVLFVREAKEIKYVNENKKEHKLRIEALKY